MKGGPILSPFDMKLRTSYRAFYFTARNDVVIGESPSSTFGIGFPKNAVMGREILDIFESWGVRKISPLDSWNWRKIRFPLLIPDSTQKFCLLE